MNSILITGGAGFIGSNFIFYMLKKHPEYKLICVDSLTYAGNIETLYPILDEDNFTFMFRSPSSPAALKLFWNTCVRTYNIRPMPGNRILRAVCW